MEFLISDMVTISEFLGGIWFESWQEHTDVYRCVDGFFGHSRQVRLSDVTSALSVLWAYAIVNVASHTGRSIPKVVGLSLNNL
jgi:hypothetical protein